MVAGCPWIYDLPFTICRACPSSGPCALASLREEKGLDSCFRRNDIEWFSSFNQVSGEGGPLPYGTRAAHIVKESVGRESTL